MIKFPIQEKNGFNKRKSGNHGQKKDFNRRKPVLPKNEKYFAGGAFNPVKKSRFVARSVM